MDYEYEGLDFRYQMREVLQAPLFAGMAEPELVLERVGEPIRRPGGTVLGGWARYEEHLVVVYLWTDRRRMCAMSTMLHELVHLRLGPGVQHRPLFRQTFREAARQAYGIRVPWTSCQNMRRYVQWGLAEMANRGFWESIADAKAGRWEPPVPEWWSSRGSPPAPSPGDRPSSR